MSLLAQNALSAYSQVSLNAKIASASPQALVSMLFDGAIAALAKAKYHVNIAKSEKGSKAVESIAEKGVAISRAIAIIEDGLKGSLNLEAGGDLADNLYALYEYMVNRLIHANINNDVEALEEVSLRLSELADAWNNMESRAAERSSVEDELTVSRSGVVTYGKV